MGVAKTLARVRADGVIERAVRERGEVEQEAIRIGLEAAFGNDAAIVDVKIWSGVAEFSYKRRPLNRDRRVVEEALEAALPGVVERVARAGVDVVAAAVRGVGWQPEEPPVFEVEGPGDAQAELSSDPWRVQPVQFVPFLLTPKPPAIIRPPFPPFPKSKLEPPGPGFVWRGRPGRVPGSKEGSWYNPGTKQQLRPDLDHPGHGPHWDYKGPDGRFRWYPNGVFEPKGA